MYRDVFCLRPFSNMEEEYCPGCSQQYCQRKRKSMEDSDEPLRKRGVSIGDEPGKWWQTLEAILQGPLACEHEDPAHGSVKVKMKPKPLLSK